MKIRYSYFSTTYIQCKKLFRNSEILVLQKASKNRHSKNKNKNTNLDIEIFYKTI